MSIHFFALKGPFSDMKVGTQIYKHDFTEQVSILIILYFISKQYNFNVFSFIVEHRK